MDWTGGNCFRKQPGTVPRKNHHKPLPPRPFFLSDVSLWFCGSSLIGRTTAGASFSASQSQSGISHLLAHGLAHSGNPHSHLFCSHVSDPRRHIDACFLEWLTVGCSQEWAKTQLFCPMKAPYDARSPHIRPTRKLVSCDGKIWLLKLEPRE